MPPKKKKGNIDDFDDDESNAVAATLASLNLKESKGSTNNSKNAKPGSQPSTKKTDSKPSKTKNIASDDDSPPVAPRSDEQPTKKVTTSSTKKTKTSSKGKRNDSDDEDDDPLKKMRELAVASDDDDSDDVSKRKSVIQSGNKQAKNVKQKREDSDDDNDSSIDDDDRPKGKPSKKKVNEFSDDEDRRGTGKQSKGKGNKGKISKTKALDESDDENSGDDDRRERKSKGKGDKGKVSKALELSDDDRGYDDKDIARERGKGKNKSKGGSKPKVEEQQVADYDEVDDKKPDKVNISKQTSKERNQKQKVTKKMIGNQDLSDEDVVQPKKTGGKTAKQISSQQLEKSGDVDDDENSDEEEGEPNDIDEQIINKETTNQLEIPTRDDDTHSELSPEPIVVTQNAPDTQPSPSEVKKEEAVKLSEIPVATVKVEKSTVPVPEPEKPKTALQLKMERLKKEKQEREAAAKIAAEEAALRKAEEDRLNKLKEEEEKKLAAEVAAQKKAEELALQHVVAVTTVEAAKKSSEKESVESPTIVLTEEEIQARLESTMYGDDVHTEYGRPVVDDDDSNQQTTTKKKLSNKDRRKLARDQESRDREEEYRLAMMKRSIEGAQFAVSQSAVNIDDPMWQNSLDISIPSLTISAHNKELFLNAELNIAHGRRYGLVGPNGAGKSTLLKMIAYGELKLPPRIDYLYVEQEVIADETPAVEAVLKADKERWELMQEEKQILKELERGPNESLDERLGEIYEQLSTINAAAAEPKARRILFGLGFDGEMQIRPTKYFSGGWRMRISLARALFIEPTLLMLDEPTNHLDLNAVIWLDDYLQRWKKTLLIVSHDQDFLNSVCQEIIHLDDKKLVTYRGSIRNYDTFKDQEKIKREQQQKAWEKQEKKIRELKSKGITTKAAEKEQAKLRSREPGARANKRAEAAATAQGGVESAENQPELIKRPREYTVKFHFPEVSLINPPILQVMDVHFRYQPHLPWLFKNLSFGLDMSSRVCIVGPNGSGKSTLLKIITGEVEPPDGMVRRNPRLRVGVYNQHFVDRLPMDEDPVTYLRRLFNHVTYQEARNLLGRFGLEGHAHTITIRDLSGGQKARVVFAELSLMAPHILFLDEPTNNLDIESIDALCDAIRDYNGGVVLVSHDARLIETTNCQLWVVEDFNVTPWEKGFGHYREYLLQKLEEQLSLIIPGSGERPGEKVK